MVALRRGAREGRAELRGRPPEGREGEREGEEEEEHARDFFPTASPHTPLSPHRVVVHINPFLAILIFGRLIPDLLLTTPLPPPSVARRVFRPPFNSPRFAPSRGRHRERTRPGTAPLSGVGWAWPDPRDPSAAAHGGRPSRAFPGRVLPSRSPYIAPTRVSISLCLDGKPTCARHRWAADRSVRGAPVAATEIGSSDRLCEWMRRAERGGASRRGAHHVDPHRNRASSRVRAPPGDEHRAQRPRSEPTRPSGLCPFSNIARHVRRRACPRVPARPANHACAPSAAPTLRAPRPLAPR